MIAIIKNRLIKGVVSQDIADVPKEVEILGNSLKSKIIKKYKRSFHIREVDTGSCSACESEIISTTNPLYDIQRFGVDFVASPRHADALMVTGPVSKNMLVALKKTFDAVPEPKLVITVGDCAFDGGIFRNSYYVENGVDGILPITLHIPGCPPKPIDIIKSLLHYFKSRNV
jgi:Ni,Fe-hydrogenase III small subunit